MKNGHVIVPAVVIGGALLALHLVNERQYKRELDGLRTDMESLSVSMDKAQDLAAKEAPRPPRAPVAPPQAPPEPKEEEAPAPREVARAAGAGEPPGAAEMKIELETVFKADGPDPSWTNDAERAVTSRLAAVLPKASALRGVDCHASLCRIDTTHADLDSYRQFVQGAVLHPDTRVWNAGFFSSPPTLNEDGELLATLYLAREGEPLPLRMTP